MKLTKKEQSELKHLDKRVRNRKATYAQLLRAFDLKRKRDGHVMGYRTAQ